MVGILVIFVMCAFLMYRGVTGSFAVSYDKDHKEHKVCMRLAQGVYVAN